MKRYAPGWRKIRSSIVCELLWRADRVREEIDEDLRFHMEMRYESTEILRDVPRKALD